MEYDVDQKDIENGDNSPPGEVSCSPKPGEVKSTSNNSTTETEKLQTPAKLASLATNPGQNPCTMKQRTDSWSTQ